MWIYLLLILAEFIKAKEIKPEGGRVITYIPRFVEFVMDELWIRSGGKTPYDDEEDIHEDLKTAGEVGFLNLPDDGRHIVITEQQLREINELVENLKNRPPGSVCPAIDEYLERIGVTR
jgi:hypothetical protein